MLSVLVCHSYFLRLDQKQLQRGKPYPPLATLQVAAMLQEDGTAGGLFRRDARGGVGGVRTHARERAAASRAALRGYVQFPEQDVPRHDAPRRLPDDRLCAARGRSRDRSRSRRQRRAGALPSGGSGRRSDRRRSVRPVGSAGAARCPSERLCRRPRRRAYPASACCGRTRSSPPAVLVCCRSADYEGSAAWDLVDMERYRSVWLKAHGYFSLNMAASRGCSFRCAWCAKPTWGNHYLQRNAVDVAIGDGVSEAHLRSRPHLVCR